MEKSYPVKEILDVLKRYSFPIPKRTIEYQIIMGKGNCFNLNDIQRSLDMLIEQEINLKKFDGNDKGAFRDTYLLE